MTRVTGITHAPLAHILQNLRPEDQEEMDAVHGRGWSVRLIADAIHHLAENNCGWMFWDDGPVAVVGAYKMTPTCAGVWAFGTAGWPRAVLRMTKHVRRVMVPELVRAGCHRAECRALFKRSDTKRWLTALGAEPEAVLSEFGTRREDFILFAWHADELAHFTGKPERGSQLPLRNGGGLC